MIGRGIAVLCLLTVLSVGSLHAQDTEIVPPSVRKTLSEAAPPPAVIKTDGKTLFEVIGTRSFSTKKRAAEIKKRIVEVAESDSTAAETVTIRGENARHLRWRCVCNVSDRG